MTALEVFDRENCSLSNKIQELQIMNAKIQLQIVDLQQQQTAIFRCVCRERQRIAYEAKLKFDKVYKEGTL